MKSLLVILGALLYLATCAVGGSRRSIRRQTIIAAPGDGIQSNGRQDIVTWDKYSLFIDGKRLMLFSGEVHPYRLPVASLYLDVFQKVKSMGMNAVSFYVFWGILEPKKGDISFEGFRDLQPFFDAAKEAGIYLIARPGPYINAETTGGGFPGWGTYTPGIWRTSNATYIEAYTGYINAVGKKIADNQITKGGPVILVQSENEYSGFASPYHEDLEYERKLMQAFIDVGITVPITTNDAQPGGRYTSVDIWGYDSYPHGFDCSHPTSWGANSVPESFWSAHMRYTPSNPNAVYEFQGGAFDGWGGSGYDTCAVLTGPDFERVFYKNEIAMSTTFLNLYMIFGGTNWGGIAHPGVYTSYDYGSAITEDRRLRDKYYELKLIANFLAVSPAYLTTRPQNVGSSAGSFTRNNAVKTTQLLDEVGGKTAFYVVRPADASKNAVQRYQLTVQTSVGSVTIPTIGGSLTLNGKDSKIHVIDYDAGNSTVVYSSAEIMTWATTDGKDIVLLYGDVGQLHETAIKSSSPGDPRVISGDGSIKTKSLATGVVAIQYTTTGQTVVEVGSTLLYILDRTNAYQFWVLQTASSPIVVKGGYLLRSASTNAGTLALVGDLNSTTTFEIVAPSAITLVTFNGEPLRSSKTPYGSITATKTVSLPDITLPDLSSLTWKKADSLPEKSSSYSDAAWKTANLTRTVNPTTPSTPVVLYSGEYGYHTGNILWRAHFSSTGGETAFKVKVAGGAAFAYSAWLDSTFLGSWEGNAPWSDYESTFRFPDTLRRGSTHVITVLQDHMGYEEDFTAAGDNFKRPRGILSYSFQGGSGTEVDTWKVTGNLGGEDYVDKTRGPLNEGGLYAERQGWHLPGFDDSSWESGQPTDGINTAGVAFYRTSFKLDIPSGVDYPIAFAVSNSTTNPHYRAQFYVNGYQFGKYINSIGPQKVFPVPQGVLNHQGDNTFAVSLWAAKESGAKLDSLKLQLNARIESSIGDIVLVSAPAWSKRNGAY